MLPLLLFTFLNVADIPPLPYPLLLLTSIMFLYVEPTALLSLFMLGCWVPAWSSYCCLCPWRCRRPCCCLTSLFFWRPWCFCEHSALDSIPYCWRHSCCVLASLLLAPLRTLYTVGGILSYSKIKHIRLSYYGADSFFGNRTFEFQTGELAKLSNYRILTQGLNPWNSDPVEPQIYEIRFSNFSICTLFYEIKFAIDLSMITIGPMFFYIVNYRFGNHKIIG